jgi:hypothetical protein
MIYYIYVIGPDSGFPCKIGIAMDTAKRLASLQTAHWENLYLYEAFPMVNKGRSYKIERIIHRRLKDHCIRGEWFNLLVSDASKAIKELLEELKEVPKSTVDVIYSKPSLIYNDKRKRKILKYVV